MSSITSILEMLEIGNGRTDVKRLSSKDRKWFESSGYAVTKIKEAYCYDGHIKCNCVSTFYRITILF